MSTVNYAGTAFTAKSLFDLKGSELVKLHNKLADEVGLPHNNHFSSKQSGTDRVWKLLLQCGTGATQPADAVEGKAAPKVRADKPPKAPKAPRAGKKQDASKLLIAGAVPERKGILIDIYFVAKKYGPVAREQLVELALSTVTPPRSKAFDRNYVLGYISSALRQGYLTAIDVPKV